MKPRGISRRHRRPSTRPWRSRRRRRARPGRARARPPPRPIWFEVRERAGATEFLGYDTETAEGEIRAIVKGGKEVKRAQGRRGRRARRSTRRRSTASPAARSATQGVIKGPKGALFRVTDTQKKLGDLFVHIGMRREGHVQARRCRRAARRSRAPHGHPRQPLGDASAARGAAAGAGHARRPEGLAGGARAAALRLLPSQADERGGDRRRRGAWPTPSCCRTRRSRRA